MKRMRILILTPADLPAVGGNVTTVRRWKRHLERRGHVVRVMTSVSLPDLDRFRPGIIHCYHAYKSGRHLLPILDRLPAPLVVSLPGTDLNLDARRAERSSVIRRVLARAAAVIASNHAMAPEVAWRYGVARSKIHFVPRGVDLSFRPWPLRRRLGIGGGEPIILFPAGIRHVKNQLFPIGPLSRLRRSFHLVYVGPVLEKSYANQLARRVERFPWIHRLDPVPLACMGGLYREADIVLNCSRSEGMPNNILEAMAAGRVVVASDIPGNRDLIADGADGFLYRGGETFARIVKRLLADAGLRKRIGRRARRKASEDFSTTREIERLLRVYRKA